MKIGLIDVDGHSGFPNLALMRLSAWHKNRGDVVEWWNGFCRYDRVYMSKVFTFTPDVDTVINAAEIIRGGTGYKDYGSLPDEIERTAPDYSIYPGVDYAIGFLTRGCIRRCPWCIVPQKEGQIRPAATWEEIKRPDSRKIIFMDNNVLACEHGLQQIEAMGGQRIWVDFNQGLDARLITPETAALLARLKWIKFVRLSCDTSEMIPVIERAVAYMKKAGIAKSRFWAYMLVQDVEEANRRACALDKMGIEIFAQPYRDYNGGEPTEEQRQFARWVNRKLAEHTDDLLIAAAGRPGEVGRRMMALVLANDVRFSEDVYRAACQKAVDIADADRVRLLLTAADHYVPELSLRSFSRFALWRY